MNLNKLVILFAIMIPVVITGCKDGVSNDTEEGLIWSDEFDGDRLDYDKWHPETGDWGWGNNEWQNYTANQNTEVSDGTLKIVAKKVGEGQKAGDYTSARLNSIESFLYGRMEIRAKIPDLKGNGLWPAIWMLGESIRTGEQGWPACGEIDIMEYVSYRPDTFFATIHSSANNHMDGTQKSSGPVTLNDIEEEFHVFGVIWQEDFLKFYVDDPSNIIFRFNKPENPTQANWPFDKPHFFLLNLAVGGNWGGAQGVDDNIFPATFEIDYVRVYEE